MVSTSKENTRNSVCTNRLYCFTVFLRASVMPSRMMKIAPKRIQYYAMGATKPFKVETFVRCKQANQKLYFQFNLAIGGIDGSTLNKFHALYLQIISHIFHRNKNIASLMSASQLFAYNYFYSSKIECYKVLQELCLAMFSIYLSND